MPRTAVVCSHVLTLFCEVANRLDGHLDVLPLRRLIVGFSRRIFFWHHKHFIFRPSLISSVGPSLNAFFRQSLTPAWLLILLITYHSSLITTSAQSATATLSGTVVDQNNAVVPNVSIAVINIAQGFERSATTNEEGAFVIPLLPPGNYIVKAEREGFVPAEVRDVILNVNDQSRLKISLKVGGVDQTVDIVDTPPLINESPAVATTVDRQFVGNLPLNGRSFQSLLALTPGLVRTGAIGNEAGQFSVNGQRATTNYFMVDGVSANASINSGLVPGQAASGSLPALTALGGTNNLVSIDALEEFKVQTSTYGAEFGRTPGAQISIATRSGTNQFHGTLFEYFRNDLLDATDWFVNANPVLRKPALRQNDFGGVIGGPIFLPRFGEGGRQPWYNGRNRTFFFFSYEGLRLRQPKVLETHVPSLSARQSAADSIKPILNAYPLPNGPENVVNRFAPFAASFSDPSTLDTTGIRIDHTFGQRLTFFGRYNYSTSETVQRSAGIFSLNTLNSLGSDTQTLTMGATLNLSSRIINELRANYTRYKGSSSFTLDNFGGAVVPDDSLLFPSFTLRQDAVITVLSFVAGVQFGGLNVGTLADNLNRQVNIIDNISVVADNHTLKFGIDYRRLTPVIAPRTYSQQAIFFDAAQFLSGRPLLVNVAADQIAREPMFNNLSLYGQDTWKVNPRLSLTYGLRWEFNPVPYERNGNEARTVTGFDDPTTTALAPTGTPLYKTTYNNFAPRIGFSYLLRPQTERETILRGGFGVFYDLGNEQVGSAYGQVFPFGALNRLFNAPFPLNPADAAPPAFSSVPFFSFIFAFDPSLKLPYTLQWNFAVEQLLGSNQKISASYVAARGHRLLRQDTISRFPSFLSIFVIRNVATSHYDSLQVQFQRRLTRGLQAQASYTWSKSLDTASNDSTPFPSALLIDPRQNRGPSDFDFRHVFSGAVTYNIPTPDAGMLGNAILRGWSLDSVVTAQSAFPVNILTGASFFGSTSTARPDLITEESLYIADPTAPGGRRINRSAFVAPPLGPDGTPARQGSLGRNALRGFPLFQTDLTLRRQFKITESFNLQFRTDFFNVFNHPNFGSVCNDLSTCSDAQFGRATQMLNNSLGNGGINGGFNPVYQIGGPRSIQFSLKAQF